MHSIILPCYNGALYIEECILSVLSQISEADELIIIDDASTDGSSEIIQSFEDDRIRIIHRNKNAKEIYKNFEGIDEDFWIWFQFTKIEQGFYFNPFKVKKYGNPIWELDQTNENSEVDLELKNRHKWEINDTAPKELSERLIEMFSKKGEMVLDVFSGSALVPVTAYMLGRNSIGVDISKDQKDLTLIAAFLDPACFKHLSSNERDKAWSLLKKQKY